MTGSGAPIGEKMIWAFEQALGVARVDPDLLNHLLASAACLLAHAHGESPRAVLAAFARRSISDREWSERYAVLFSAGYGPGDWSRAGAPRSRCASRAGGGSERRVSPARSRTDAPTLP